MEQKELLKVVHVDDDRTFLQQMSKLLNSESDIEYLRGFTSAEEAYTYLALEKVDLLILDVEMPGKGGLWLANELRQLRPNIAFVTSHAGFVSQAFEACALDYLLKPMDKNQLHVLLEKVRYKKMNGIASMQEQVEAIYQYLNPSLRPKRIFISMVGETRILQLEEILYFRAQNNYTIVVMKNGEQHLSSKTIRTYEEALTHHSDFMRVSRGYMVNKNFIKKVERDGKTRKINLLLTNGDRLETSFKNKDEILDQLTS